MLKRAGGDDELIGDLSFWELAPRFDDRERAVLGLAEHLTRHPAVRIGDELWTRLQQQFADDQIVELVACIGAFNAFNRMANSLGIEITR